MKILLISLIFIQVTFAESKREKTLNLKASIHSMLLEKNGNYRLELTEYAAAYTSLPKFLPCLQKSMKENKKANLKVDAFSLNVLDCKN